MLRCTCTYIVCESFVFFLCSFVSYVALGEVRHKRMLSRGLAVVFSKSALPHLSKKYSTPMLRSIHVVYSYSVCIIIHLSCCCRRRRRHSPPHITLFESKVPKLTLSFSLSIFIACSQYPEKFRGVQSSPEKVDTCTKGV